MNLSRTVIVLADLVLVCGVLQASATPGAAGSGTTRSQKVTQSDVHKTPGAVRSSPISKIEAHANLVLVDVVVTHHGRHVKGLKETDFKVFDNGKRQRITVFDEHTERTPIARGKAATEPKLPPGVYSNRPALPDHGVATVLLLDALNTPVTDQMYVRKQMVQLLKKLPRRAPLAIFALGTRLRMVQGFDGNTGALVAAMRGRQMVNASAVLQPEFSQAEEHEMQEIVELGATRTGLQALRQFEAHQTSMRTDLRVKITLRALDELAEYLRLIPGRKNLIWVSGSFPFAIYRDDTLPAPLETEREYGRKVAWAAALMSSARVAVYPVGARGLTSLPSTSAMESSSDSSDVMNNNAIGALTAGGKARNGMSLTASATGAVQPGTFAEPSMAKSDWNFLRQTSLERQSMQALAQDTGGQVFADRNDIGQEVAEAMQEGADYYTVGYVPHFRRHDESFHRLKVKLPRGDHADYRNGYYADTAIVDPHPGHVRMAAAILDDGPPVPDLRFEVRLRMGKLVKARGAKKRSRECEIAYAVPVKGVDFKQGAGHVRRARLEVVAVAYDKNGKNLKFADERAEVRLPAAVYRRVKDSAMPIRQKIEIPEGTVRVRVVVHDLEGGKIGATGIPLPPKEK